MINSEELINKVKTYNKFLNPEKLSKAYNYAVKAHENQKRDSGDPYSNHPIAVASILSELELDSATIVTGLLHDTIEDTHATYENIKDDKYWASIKTMLLYLGYIDEKFEVEISIDDALARRLREL